jgi:hypothetical protein
MKPRGTLTQKTLSSYPSSKLRIYLIKIWRNLAELDKYYTKFSKKLCSFTVFYSHKQNVTIINVDKQKIVQFCPFFTLNNFILGPFTDFKLKSKNFDLALFKLEFEPETAKFQYRSCLLYPMQCGGVLLVFKSAKTAFSFFSIFVVNLPFWGRSHKTILE